MSSVGRIDCPSRSQVLNNLVVSINWVIMIYRTTCVLCTYCMCVCVYVRWAYQPIKVVAVYSSSSSFSGIFPFTEDTIQTLEEEMLRKTSDDLSHLFVYLSFGSFSRQRPRREAFRHPDHGHDSKRQVRLLGGMRRIGR